MQKASNTIKSAPSTTASAPKGKLDQFYARLEKTKPGAEESRRISEQILEAIFDRHGSR